MLNELFNIQNRYLAAIPTNFKRYLYDEINWNNRLNIITGARGSGKTPLVPQHFRAKYGDIQEPVQKPQCLLLHRL